MTDARPNVVRQLVEILSDDAMSIESRVELARGADATREESIEAILIFTGLTLDELREAGTVEVATPHVLDLTIRELQAYAWIYAVISKWDLIHRDPGYRLESAMKVIPPEDAAEIVRAIKFGGLA
jgi:hypothetical protein